MALYRRTRIGQLRWPIHVRNIDAFEHSCSEKDSFATAKPFHWPAEQLQCSADMVDLDDKWQSDRYLTRLTVAIKFCPQARLMVGRALYSANYIYNLKPGLQSVFAVSAVHTLDIMNP
jgi:hypothetical protein